jgi:hypothetical protein
MINFHPLVSTMTHIFEEDVVLVVGVLHGSRHPRHWMHRA